jgi:hypothetical protein
MATYSQVVIVRGQQTQGVWALDDAFTGGGQSKDTHQDQIDLVAAAQTAVLTADGAEEAKDQAVLAEHAFFKAMNVALFQRLDSEVPDDAPLQRRVDEAGAVRQDSELAIEQRAALSAVIWAEVNAARAAAVPVLLPVVVRGTTQAQFKTRLGTLPDKKQEREAARGVLKQKRSVLKSEARKLDLWNKAWYQAWKSEFPPGTPQGDALAGVDTDEGGEPPEILEIAAATPQGAGGLSLLVTYVPESGAHATVLELLYKVKGAPGSFTRVTADVGAGNLIGPFTSGQVVQLQTEVGNSRDLSELSPLQEVMIGS